jgi:hypothetical protein
VRIPGEPVRTYSGADELRTFVGAHTYAPQRVHKHVYVEARIEHTGRGEASVTSYLFRIDERDSQSWVYASGRYHDTVVACEDGRWRLRRRIVEVDVLRPEIGAAGYSSARPASD